MANETTIFDWCADMRARGASPEELRLLNGFLAHMQSAVRKFHKKNIRAARQYADFSMGGNSQRGGK